MAGPRGYLDWTPMGDPTRILGQELAELQRRMIERERPDAAQRHRLPARLAAAEQDVDTAQATADKAVRDADVAYWYADRGAAAARAAQATADKAVRDADVAYWYADSATALARAAQAAANAAQESANAARSVADDAWNRAANAQGSANSAWKYADDLSGQLFPEINTLKSRIGSLEGRVRRLESLQGL
nr:MAG TPA: Pulmonary surfactant-associated protein D surfactant protein, trimer, ambiguous [Caudoviricetes sp.]